MMDVGFAMPRRINTPARSPSIQDSGQPLLILPEVDQDVKYGLEAPGSLVDAAQPSGFTGVRPPKPTRTRTSTHIHPMEPCMCILLANASSAKPN